MASLRTLAVGVLAGVASAVPFSAANVLFGTAIKNGPIQPHVETEVFAHNCTTAPCTVTQIHVPSIYPGGGCPWDWESGELRIYIDGASTPTIDITLLQMAAVSAAADVGNAHKDVSPFGARLFGKNAQTGGVWSTVRIPFGSSIRVTLTQAASCDSQGTYWFIIRGVEGLPVSLSELDLPPEARLYVAKNANLTLQPREFVTLAAQPAGMDGALLYTFLDAASSDPNYLEGCFRFYGPGSDGVNNTGPTLFLSSGTEDYFLSASYFDEGTFASPDSGLTYRGAGGDLSAYKTHDRDLVPFHGGFSFLWRNEETANCPTGWPPNPAPPAAASGSATPASVRSHKLAAAGFKAAPPGAPRVAPVTVTTLVYYYAWPSSASA